jgi:hypothetical protein
MARSGSTSGSYKSIEEDLAETRRLRVNNIVIFYQFGDRSLAGLEVPVGIIQLYLTCGAQGLR